MGNNGFNEKELEVYERIIQNLILLKKDASEAKTIETIQAIKANLLNMHDSLYDSSNACYVDMQV